MLDDVVDNMGGPGSSGPGPLGPGPRKLLGHHHHSSLEKEQSPGLAPWQTLVGRATLYQGGCAPGACRKLVRTQAQAQPAGAGPARSRKAGLWRSEGADRLHACGAEECEAALYAVGRDVLVLVVSVIIGIVYAARRRTLLRKQLGIAGARRLKLYALKIKRSAPAR